MNTFKYKNYTGSVEYDEEYKIYHGKVQNIKDLILYEGKSIEELEHDFYEAVDRHIELKKVMKNKDPHGQKTTSG